MRWLASYLMRGRSQAVLVTVVSGVLSVVLPPLSFISSAAVGLVTLRHGQQQGILLLLLATLAGSLLSMLALGSPMPAIALAIGFWIPVIGLAALLRNTISLGLVCNVVMIIGMCVVLAVYASVDNPAQWWKGQLELVFAPVLQNADAQQAGLLRSSFPALAEVMTGLMTLAWLLNGLISLMLARWWQAMLYNPGGFRQEFHGLQLGKPAAVVTAFVLLLAWLMPQALGGAVVGLLVVTLAIVSLQGIAIAHAWVAAGQRHVIWLVAFYLATVVFMKPVAMLLVLLGMLDPWFDVRRRFARRVNV